MNITPCIWVQIRRAVYGGPYIDLLDKLSKNSRFQVGCTAQLCGVCEQSLKGTVLPVRGMHFS